MSYVERHLIAGETLIYLTRLHWIVLIWPVALGLLFGVSGFVLLARLMSTGSDKSDTSTLMLVGGLILIVAGGVSFTIGLLKRNATEMAVTDRRVIIKQGIGSR